MAQLYAPQQSGLKMIKIIMSITHLAHLHKFKALMNGNVVVLAIEALLIIPLSNLNRY